MNGVDVDVETEDGDRSGVCEADAAALTRRASLGGAPIPPKFPCHTREWLSYITVSASRVPRATILKRDACGLDPYKSGVARDAYDRTNTARHTRLRDNYTGGEDVVSSR